MLLYARKSGASGVHGVVAELIEVPEKLERAIDMVLGGALQNIVVERGLVSGEDIVVEGYHKLQHGMKVEPVAPRRDEEAEKQQ